MFKEGMSILDFNCNTVDGKKSIKELLTNKKNILIFSRFYGCRIAKYELKDFSDNYKKIIKKGYEVLFVLQSSEEIVKKAYLEEKYPFTIICDTKREIYKYFDIGLAENKEILGEGSVGEKLQKAEKMGLKKGEPEGEPLQLPAQFIINENLQILYSYYGKNAGDILNPASILKVINIS